MLLEAAAHEERALDVQRVHALPVREGERLERDLAVDVHHSAGDVRDPVDRAELGQSMVDRGSRPLLGRHVDLDGAQRAREPGRLLDGFGHASRAQVDPEHLGADLEQPQGRRPADPAPGAGDDVDSLVQREVETRWSVEHGESSRCVRRGGRHGDHRGGRQGESDVRALLEVRGALLAQGGEALLGLRAGEAEDAEGE